MSPTHEPVLGLRELKKVRAKLALEKTALDLFASKGYDETTVEEIAAAAEISRASFFRYFNSKDDVLGSDDERRRDAFMAALRNVPDDVPVVNAVQQATRSYADGLDEDAATRSLTYFRIMIGSRALLGRAYEIRITWLRELEAELARRLGDRADADRLAALLANVTLGVLETAVRLVFTTADTDLDEVLDYSFSLVRDPSAT